MADGIEIVFTPNDRATLPGKLADVELRFSEGLFAGLKLIGFGLWERRAIPGGLNVTFPCRQYAVNGERRSFALLRPYGGDVGPQDRVRAAIIAAWQAYQAEHEAAERSA